MGAAAPRDSGLGWRLRAGTGHSHRQRLVGAEARGAVTRRVAGAHCSLRPTHHTAQRDAAGLGNLSSPAPAPVSSGGNVHRVPHGEGAQSWPPSSSSRAGCWTRSRCRAAPGARRVTGVPSTPGPATVPLQHQHSPGTPGPPGCGCGRHLPPAAPPPHLGNRLPSLPARCAHTRLCT